MKRAPLALVGAGLLFTMLAVGSVTYYLHFYRHKAGLTERLTSLREGAEGYQNWLDARPPVRERLSAFADATLGFDVEVVDARFRSGLNRMAASAGLVREDTVVNVRPTPVALKNPTVGQRQPVAEFRRFMRLEGIDTPDLYMLDAELRGSGSLEAAVRLLALAQTQPWIWSVRRFSITPQGGRGGRFDISVSLSTAVLPDLAPESRSEEGEGRPSTEPPPIQDPDAGHLLATTAIVTRNVFAPPPPPPAKPEPQQQRQAEAKPRPTESAPPPPPPPYHEWRLTAFSESPGQGALAWLLNTRTGTALRLSPGEQVLDATLVGAGPGRAVFQIGEARFTLSLNETLADRHPVD